MTNQPTAPLIASTAGPSAPSTTTPTTPQQPGTAEQLRASWNKSLVVEVVGVGWYRKAHLPKRPVIVYVEPGKNVLNMRDADEFKRLFNKEVK